MWIQLRVTRASHNQATGKTKASFSMERVTAGVQQKFDNAKADVNVRSGKPGLLKRFVSLLKGDPVATVTIVNQAPASESSGIASAPGHSSGRDTTGLDVDAHVHMDQISTDDPGTSAINERETEVVNTAAHEAGHEFGPDHNKNNPQDIMTFPNDLADPSSEFNEQDAAMLREVNND